jgi:hypothetical protein
LAMMFFLRDSGSSNKLISIIPVKHHRWFDFKNVVKLTLGTKQNMPGFNSHSAAQISHT